MAERVTILQRQAGGPERRADFYRLLHRMGENVDGILIIQGAQIGQKIVAWGLAELVPGVEY